MSDTKPTQYVENAREVRRQSAVLSARFHRNGGPRNDMERECLQEALALRAQLDELVEASKIKDDGSTAEAVPAA